MASTWCRTDVSIAEVRAPACDAKLSQLPTAFSCLGQQVSVSVQNSILGKAYVYQQRMQAAQLHAAPAPLAPLSPRQKRRLKQKAKAKHLATFQPASSEANNINVASRAPLSRPLDPIADLGGQQGRAGLGLGRPTSLQVGDNSPPNPQLAGAGNHPTPMQSEASPPDAPSPADTSMPQAAEPPAPPVPADFPDTPNVSAMMLWAQDRDVSTVHARQAVLHMHEHHFGQLSQHATDSAVALPHMLEPFMVLAIRAVTGDASFESEVDTAAALLSASSQSCSSTSAQQLHCSPPNAQPAAAQLPTSAAATAAAAAAAAATAAASASTAHPAPPRRSSRTPQPVQEFWRGTAAGPGGAQ